MSYAVTCDCGRSLAVRAGDAGAQKTCDCGASVTVPSLSALQKSADSAPTTKPRTETTNPIIVYGVAIAALVAAGLYSRGALQIVGLLMFVGSRWWLAGMILREMDLVAALMVLLMPFVPTYFVIKRFDIAWKPFLLGTAGLIIAILCGPMLTH